jgi:cytochrome P450
MQTEAAPAPAPFEFNPEDPEYTRSPYDTYSHLLRSGPYYWAKHDAYVFTRYEEVATIMRDRRFTLNWREWEHRPPAPSGEVSEFDRLTSAGLFSIDAADHTRLRKLVAPAFTPRAVEGMRVKVQAIVDEALAGIKVVDGRFDVTEYADYIPLRAISTVLGIPREHDATFRRFGMSIVDASNPRLTPEERARVLEPFPAGSRLIRALIEERRKAPTEDMLSTLIQVEEAGDRLNHDELVSMVMGLIAAGSETTVHLICFAVYNLLRHPSEMALVKADPSLMRQALEEVLRFDSFGKNGVPRFPTEPMEFGGVKLRKGQLVFPHLPAALRDPDVFTNPDVFDIRRDRVSSIVFGTGPHHCVGAALARLEGDLAVSSLLARFPDLALAGEPTFAPHPFLRKMDSLPLRTGG